jgi:hypothetical protein
VLIGEGRGRRRRHARDKKRRGPQGDVPSLRIKRKKGKGMLCWAKKPTNKRKQQHYSFLSAENAST